ncbi:transglycosylase domain-containing protein [Ramlibacter ginsenosidimutans]|uniref:Transglycosylase domain-containing protein n=1 Tax=Ramlibacter ginsenosidimutans TaxID=502333 RepID=A0A934TXW8_9BURK|nr:transglycosylase domain-containing protein [Ramlibacter ginsenosidimutans]MBK6009508.1 transglycosylase domain-containing protein [Ramlibacter ginsenosidimutans]
MKDRPEGETASGGGRLQRTGRWLRRHKWKAAALLPLSLVAALAIYVAILFPLTPSIGDIRKAKQESPSVVLSADGKQLAVFRRANRDWVKLSDISPNVIDALLATEDKRFYQHHGIDFVRTGKAMLRTMTGEVEGGSTITQQLARNLYPEEIGRDQNITRKIKEAITALKIESIYSKNEILESYLNSVSFLYNAWGIEMAARTYFGKSAKDLNKTEAATLVGMLKGTAYYNPVLNPERALQRRNTVLQLMVKGGKLQESSYEQLKDQPLKLKFVRLDEDDGPAPHLAEYLKRWLQDWADQHDYNIYSDGLVVRTTIDSRLQEMADQAVARQTKALQAVADVEWSRSTVPSLGGDASAYVAADKKDAAFDYFWDSHAGLVKSWMRDTPEYKQAREGGKDDAQALKELREDTKFMRDLRRQKTMLEAGFLAIDPSTGAIKAWVGSRDWDADKFDHVQQARRQPGSTFKPFVYGAAFELGHRPDETLMDQAVAIQIDKNQVWRPGDIEGPPTNEPMTLRDGLAKSKNTITAQLMMEVGPARVASLARAMGVRQSKLDEVPSLALGTSPVTLKEMVTSFATIANGGNYMQPIVVTAVENRQHEVLESFGAHTPEQALSTPAAQTLLDVMRGVIDYGTAAGLRPRFGLTGDLAGKTGTTQDNTDGWFIVMHPQLVAGAWVGFDDNRVTMRSSYWGQGAHNALFIVGDMLQQAEKAGVIDAKATFSAPHTRDDDKPLVDRMGDWLNSVFNAAPADPTVAGVPPAAPAEGNGAPPQLQPAPSPLPASSLSTAQSPPATVRPDAPVIVSEPQRVPTYPRPLEAARPVDTVPGTQVYRSPDATAVRPSDAPPPSEVVRGPAQPRGAGSTQGGTATLGAAREADGNSSTPRASTTITLPRNGGAVTQRDAAGSSYEGASGSNRRAADSYEAIPARRRDSADSASYGNASGNAGSSYSSGSGSSYSGDSAVGTATGSPSAAE